MIKIASGDALLPEEATIYIVASSTNPSSLTSTDAVTAEVASFEDSGGEEDLESRQVFGGGNIDLIKPRTQIEVSFDVIMRYGSNVTKWDEYKWGSGLGSDGDAAEKAIYIQWTDGTNYYTRAYRKARGFSFEPTSSADGLLEGSMTFKLSPTQADGSKNFQVTTTVATSVSW